MVGTGSRQRQEKGFFFFCSLYMSTVTACTYADGNGTPEIEEYLCKKSREWWGDINECADAMDSNGLAGCWP